MSGHFDTVLAASVGQSLALKHFHFNLFSTKVGIRPAEPSTVASVAMHHTLSHLLLVCMKSHVEVWQLQPGNRQLRPEEAPDFQKILLALKNSAQHLCGTTANGHKLKPRRMLSCCRWEIIGLHILQKDIGPPSGWLFIFTLQFLQVCR